MISKELIQQLRVTITHLLDDESRDTVYDQARAKLVEPLLSHVPVLLDAAEECERLREEVERLKQTSVEVEKPDGSKAYVQMHCTYPHDHIANPDIGFKML
jgi:hypothetical protein